MSGSAIRWARAQKIESASLKSLLRAIADRCNPAGVTTASQATLAADMSISERQVRKTLAVAERMGLISRTKRSAGARGRTSDAIALTVSRDFNLAASDVAAAAEKGVRNRKLSKLATGTLLPVASKSQPEPGFRGIEYISTTGSAEPKTQQSFQGVRAADRRAQSADVAAPVDGVAMPPETSPHGTISSRRWTGSIYARHRALTARTTRGTVH
ncbi:helix-turn-helix domain-containing protein [Aureimonas sp. AU22]|uniref:helix-turn-helix domain-containing protein n=1 Tax=Aureimonas sp. AU22 TaxID=1638162 RepID=UPI00351C7EF6